MLIVRETVPDTDCAAICTIQNQFDPEPLFAESYLEKMKSVPEGWIVIRITAEQDRQVVGFANFRRNSGMNPGTFLLTLGVDEKHQEKGIGSEIYERVYSIAQEVGAQKVVPLVRESHKNAVQFFKNRGFSKVLSLRESFLDLSNVNIPQKNLPPGYKLVRWSELEDTDENREKFAQAFLKMDKDEPGTLLLGGFDRASIERDAFDPDCSDPDLLYLIEFNGEWVAHHQLVKNEPHTWEVAGITFTGTVPEHRRKGLASYLKNLGVRDAMARGARKIMTHNDSSNKGMLAINEKQGYQEFPGWLLMAKEL